MDDLISRQAAIDLINDIDLINFTAKGVIRGRLRKLPSAQPERKKGYWCDCWCSECGWSFEVESGFVGNPTRFSFCPNCGAKMEVNK